MYYQVELSYASAPFRRHSGAAACEISNSLVSLAPLLILLVTGNISSAPPDLQWIFFWSLEQTSSIFILEPARGLMLSDSAICVIVTIFFDDFAARYCPNIFLSFTTALYDFTYEKNLIFGLSLGLCVAPARSLIIIRCFFSVHRSNRNPGLFSSAMMQAGCQTEYTFTPAPQSLSRLNLTEFGFSRQVLFGQTWNANPGQHYQKNVLQLQTECFFRNVAMVMLGAPVDFGSYCPTYDERFIEVQCLPHQSQYLGRAYFSDPVLNIWQFTLLSLEKRVLPRNIATVKLPANMLYPTLVCVCKFPRQYEYPQLMPTNSIALALVSDRTPQISGLCGICSLVLLE